MGKDEDKINYGDAIIPEGMTAFEYMTLLDQSGFPIKCLACNEVYENFTSYALHTVLVHQTDKLEGTARRSRFKVITEEK